MPDVLDPGHGVVLLETHHLAVAVSRGQERVLLQLAKALGKCQVALDREILVAEEDHLKFQERPLDLREALVVQLPEVDPGELGAEGRGDGPDREAFETQRRELAAALVKEVSGTELTFEGVYQRGTSLAGGARSG